mgnify:CR=1 FL=1
MNNLTKYNPFEELRALQRQLFDNPFSPTLNQTVATDVYTAGSDLVVEAHLPNFSEDDVDVSLDNGALIIRGERHEKTEDSGRKYIIRESSTSFFRRIQLPEDSNKDEIKAHLEDGILRVTVPLKPLPEPKKITVKKSTKKQDKE